MRTAYAEFILLLTARIDDGADGYVCKSVRPSVLLARIKALLRRVDSSDDKGVAVYVLKFARLTVAYGWRSTF